MPLDRNPSLFLPFTEPSLEPTWIANLKALRAQDPYPSEVNSSWPSFLTYKDLQIPPFVTRGKRLGFVVAIEVYMPNQFARQFGFLKTIPLPYAISLNSTFLQRETIKESSTMKEMHQS